MHEKNQENSINPSKLHGRSKTEKNVSSIGKIFRQWTTAKSTRKVGDRVGKKLERERKRRRRRRRGGSQTKRKPNDSGDTGTDTHTHTHRHAQTQSHRHRYTPAKTPTPKRNGKKALISLLLRARWNLLATQRAGQPFSCTFSWRRSPSSFA